MVDAATRKKIFSTPEVNFLNHDLPDPSITGPQRWWMIIKSWACTVDHKRIGIMYLAGVTFALFLAGTFALVLRTHLWTFDGALPISDDMYNQMFTLHGAVMVFSFIIPSIPAALGNIALPMMLGAKDVAFPRMNLASFYLWIFGTGFLLMAILFGGGLDTGWTFYTPYSIDTQTSQRSELVQTSTFHLVTLRDRDHSGFGDSCFGNHAFDADRRKDDAHRYL